MSASFYAVVCVRFKFQIVVTCTSQFGSDQLYPKRIRLVVDVSGSMFRFNGHDGRLERTLEAALMVMEAFDKHRNFKVKGSCCINIIYP